MLMQSITRQCTAQAKVLLSGSLYRRKLHRLQPFLSTTQSPPTTTSNYGNGRRLETRPNSAPIETRIRQVGVLRRLLGNHHHPSTQDTKRSPCQSKGPSIREETRNLGVCGGNNGNERRESEKVEDTLPPRRKLQSLVPALDIFGRDSTLMMSKDKQIIC